MGLPSESPEEKMEDEVVDAAVVEEEARRRKEEEEEEDDGSIEPCMPLEVDFYQAALYFATSEEVVDSAFFRALSSLESKARKRSRERLLGGPGRSRLGSCYARHRMLAFVSVLFALQVALMHQLLFSVENRSCSTSDDCVAGTSCSAWPSATGERNICRACQRLVDGNETKRVEADCFELFDNGPRLRRYSRNDAADQIVFYASRADDERRRYSPRVYVHFCAGCVDVDGRYRTLHWKARRNVRSMRFGDFVALAVCATAVALTVVSEVRETKIAIMAQKRRFRQNRHVTGHIWFAVLMALRQYLLVPQIVATIPRLVILEGGNTVQLIFNTVAVVFIVEVDNLLSTQLLSRPTLSGLERLARLHVPASDHKYLSRCQKAYFALFVGTIFIGLFADLWAIRTPGVAFGVALGAAFLAAAVEVCLYADQPHLSRIIYTTNCCCARRLCCAHRLATIPTRRIPRDLFFRSAPPATAASSAASSSCAFSRPGTPQKPPFRLLLRGEATLTRLWSLLCDLVSLSLEFYCVVAIPITVLNYTLQSVIADEG